MNKKIYITILGLIMFAAIVSVAKAEIHASIEVKDSNGASIADVTVPNPTVAYVYGTYEDKTGNSPALASMQVYFDDDLTSDPDWQLRETLFTGTVSDGETIQKTYAMAEHGYYQFRWRCKKIGTGTTERSIQCTREVSLAFVQTHVIPEPGTIAGLIMGLSAFGLLAVKKRRIK